MQRAAESEDKKLKKDCKERFEPDTFCFPEVDPLSVLMLLQIVHIFIFVSDRLELKS
jgi:hypothetical protein